MADRERKRNERRKRKERGAAREVDVTPDARERMKAGYAKAEEKNQATRESLEPIKEGERPKVLVVGAIFSAVVATIFLVSAIVALLTDTTVDGNEPSPIPLAAFAVIMLAMAFGLWTLRYWAVLGFQMLLILFLLGAVFGLIQATTILQALGTAALIAICGALFYFMVKAMARIQMPTREPR